MQVHVQGIPVHYVEVGEGRPVLLLHGMPTDHRHMVRAFEPVFERAYLTVYPDLRPAVAGRPGSAGSRPAR